MVGEEREAEDEVVGEDAARLSAQERVPGETSPWVEKPLQDYGA